MPRRAINHVYTRAFVKQQIVLPTALGGRRFSPDVDRLLGYGSDPASTLEEWYAQRAAKSTA